AKCNYCAHRVENSYEPACVIVCPTESIVSGDLDDPHSPISIRIAENDVKVRKPEAGTKPNVYYVETSDEMLDPAATALTGVGMWTDQAHGVGHFAKYADSRLAEADTPSMLVQLALEKKAKAANPRDRAIIRDVMAKLEQDKSKATRSYDQPSKGILWDGEVAAYIVTKAAASGFYILLMLLMMYGINEIEWLILPGFFASIALLGVTGLLLVKDLDKPGRFLYVILRPNWDSWLVRGAYILSGFGAILCAHVVVSMFDYAEIWHTRLAYAGIPLAWMTGAYTGWLLKQAKGRTMWAQRSDSEIALTGTIEMLICGGLPLLILWLTDWKQPESQIMVGAILIMALVYWFGFKHIRHGLREAQMDPLL
ncbi:MAG: polysulfide reductase NrfD, partial [Candidatus Poseidoniales archaeon]|nr:polysulfide reductase NrfD [Candidatus Poseidoniales archaeon]